MFCIALGISPKDMSFYAALCAVVVSAITPFCVEKFAKPVKIEESQMESLKQSIIQSRSNFSDTLFRRHNRNVDTLTVEYK